MSKYNPIRRRTGLSILVMAIFAAFLLLPGCGGETHGTGVRSLSGTVRDPLGQPKAGVQVSLADDLSATSITDELGQFDILVSVDEGNDLITLSFKEVSQPPVLGSFVAPNDSADIEIVVKLNSQAQTVEINVPATPTPHPTALASATPAATNTPAASATTAPTSVPATATSAPGNSTPPTNTPTPAATATLSPTPHGPSVSTSPTPTATSTPNSGIA